MRAPRFTLHLLATLTLIAGAVSSTAVARSDGGHARDTAPAPAPKAAPAPKKAAATPAKIFDAAKAFNELGCVGCHGDDGIYRDEIKGAIGKPVDQVARWIRNAPSIKPDTDMPSFATAIDEPDSVVLAAWMQDRAAHLQ